MKKPILTALITTFLTIFSGTYSNIKAYSDVPQNSIIADTLVREYIEINDLDSLTYHINDSGFLLNYEICSNWVEDSSTGILKSKICEPFEYDFSNYYIDGMCLRSYVYLGDYQFLRNDYKSGKIIKSDTITITTQIDHVIKHNPSDTSTLDRFDDFR